MQPSCEAGVALSGVFDLVRFLALAACLFLAPVVGAAAMSGPPDRSAGPLNGLYLFEAPRFHDVDMVRYLEIRDGVAIKGVYRKQPYLRKMDRSDCWNSMFCSWFRDVYEADVSVAGDKVIFSSWRRTGKPFGDAEAYDLYVLPGTATGSGRHGFELGAHHLTLRQGGEMETYVRSNLDRKHLQELIWVIGYYRTGDTTVEQNHDCVTAVLRSPDLGSYSDMISSYYDLWAEMSNMVVKMEDHEAGKAVLSDEEYEDLLARHWNVMMTTSYIEIAILGGDFEALRDSKVQRKALASGAVPKETVDRLVSFFRRDKIGDPHISIMLAPCWKI
jgi:hypothetical protein